MVAIEKLPEGKEITLKLRLNEARECLKHLPSILQGIKDKLEHTIKEIDFWNFLRDCQYLEAFQVDFHLTGLLNPPAWTLYCKHLENKGGADRLYLEEVPEETRNKITGSCNRDNCPIYKGS